MFKLKISAVQKLNTKSPQNGNLDYPQDPDSVGLEEQVASLGLYLVGVSDVWVSKPNKFLDVCCKVDVVFEIEEEDRAIGIQVKTGEYAAWRFALKYSRIETDYPVPGVVAKAHPVVMLKKLSELTNLPIEPAATQAIKHAKLFKGKVIPKVALRGINMYLELGLATNTGDGLKF